MLTSLKLGTRVRRAVTLAVVSVVFLSVFCRGWCLNQGSTQPQTVHPSMLVCCLGLHDLGPAPMPDCTHGGGMHHSDVLSGNLWTLPLLPSAHFLMLVLFLTALLGRQHALRSSPVLLGYGPPLRLKYMCFLK